MPISIVSIITSLKVPLTHGDKSNQARSDFFLNEDGAIAEEIFLKQGFIAITPKGNRDTYNRYHQIQIR